MTAETGLQAETAHPPTLSDELAVSPVSEIVLKVHSRCNLNCDYCYVYNLGDESWREQPKLMSQDTMESVGYRLTEYIQANFDEPPVAMQITYHGGEPLLASPEYYANASRILRQAVGRDTVLRQSVQTNGTLITNEYLDVFRHNRIGVGVSLDGSEIASNRHRLNLAGRSSHADAVRGIKMMQDSAIYRRLFHGILAVIDIENDPLETYQSLKELAPPAIDFLLPHGNWDMPPPGITLDDGERDMHEYPYAKWLNTIFDVWLENDIDRIRIRMFDSIIHGLTGGRSTVETIGGTSAGGLVVVETDGSYEMVDTLKSVPGQVNKTGLHVKRHSLAEANAFMARKAKQLGTLSLSKYCVSCPVVKQCGGGYAPHRYDREGKFNNASVYCPDLSSVITHVYGGLNAHILRRKVEDNIEAINQRDKAAKAK